MYELIVVGTDGSETAQRAVTEACALAKALDSQLHLVSAYEPVRGARVAGSHGGAVEGVEIKPDAAVQSVVEESTAAARLAGVQVTVHTAKGDAADALLAIAAREKADLIVVGNRGMHGAKRILGSVPNKVSHQAKCHVLIVATDDPA